MLFTILKIMENITANPVLAQKIQLLFALQQGKVQESQSLLAQLSTTTQTHPQLYQQFHTFVKQHKQEISQMNDESPKVQYVFEDAASCQDSWETDQSVDYSSDRQQSPAREKPASIVFKNLNNSKSSSLLIVNKTLKKPFLVQTKLKATTSTVNLLKQKQHGLKSTLVEKGVRQKSKSHQKGQGRYKSREKKENKAFRDSYLVKQNNKPMFPRIKGATTLKIVKQ